MNIADSHDTIEVRGARENNLQGIDVSFPKRRLTVVTGVSGSGKSSLVFDTIAAESRRMLNETFPAFVQGFMEGGSRPDVDSLSGITPAIIVDQDPMGSNQRSTVGTATDAAAILRKIYSQIAEPHIGSPNAYSFNVPSVTGSGMIKVKKDGREVKEHKEYSVLGGMCPRCEGIGSVKDIDPSQLYDPEKSLDDGPFTIPGYNAGGWNVKIFAQCGFFDPLKKIKDYSAREMENFLYRENAKVKVNDMNLTFNGLIPSIKKSFLNKDPEAMQPHIKAFVERAVTYQQCPDCLGTRLAQGARSSLINGLHIGQVSDLQISQLPEWIESVSDTRVTPLIASLSELVGAMINIGLGYLSLNRPTGTLSGGEAQRLRMVRHVHSSLTDVTYIFDEPTAGLHPADVKRIAHILLALRDKGNTVIVVEHKPEIMEIADHIIDIGPRAGSLGGQLVFAGTYDQLTDSDTLTGRFVSHRNGFKDDVRAPSGAIEIRGAALHNLDNVDVDIPLGCLTVLTGVAGSGKSSLLACLPDDIDAIVVDQSPIKGSRRSNPATYTSLLDPIRKAFAKEHGVKPALFSANSEGACPTCQGNGEIITELGFMDTVTTQCLDCEGRRFSDEVLEYTLAEKSIADVYAMSVDEAYQFVTTEFPIKPAEKILATMADVGLGYITLGQSLSSLSGGERQRLKLATHMKNPSGIYILDEPTTGLHQADIDQLLELLNTLVDSGTSLIVVEHHLAVMAQADWIIDMGPGAGHDGGTVVYQGPPSGLVKSETVTGAYLAQYYASSGQTQE